MRYRPNVTGVISSFAAVAAVAAVAIAAWSPIAAHSASSGGTAIGASVLATTSIDTTACPHMNLGNLLAGAVVMSNPCTVAFGSSNDTARLRVHQRDRDGRALTQAQPTWDVLSTTGRFTAAHQPSDDRVWAVGRNTGVTSVALITTSTDQGQTWTYQTPCPTATRAYDVHAFTDSIAITGGNRPCRTTDGGTAWTDNRAGTSANVTWESIDGLDDGASTFAWASGTSTNPSFPAPVRYTTDSGATWTRADVPDASDLASILAISEDEAMVISKPILSGQRHMRLYHTVDRGLNWTMKPIATLPTSQVLNYIDRSPSGAIVVAGTSTYRSTDDGDSWTMEATATPAQGLRYLSGNNWVKPFSVGNLRRSTDDGASWSPHINLGSYSYGLYEPSNEVDGKFFVPGGGESIFMSEDGGATYAEVSPYQPRFNAVAGFDDRAFVAVGDDGIVRYSTDGSDLHDGDSGTTNTLTGVVRVGPSAAVAIGAAGTIIRTDDGGATWAPVANPAAGSTLRSIDEATGRGIFYAAGDDGTILRSVDRGTTWASVPSGTSEMIVGLATDAAGQQLYVATLLGAGELRYSPDAGATWQTRPTGLPNRIKSLDTTPSGVLLVMHTNHDFGNGSNSAVERSTDSGSSWTTVYDVKPLGRLEAIDDRHVFLYDSTGIARSFDGGLTFPTTISSPVGGSNGTALDANTIIGVGAGNNILTLTPGASVPDVGESGATFASTTGAFGACLQAATSTIATHWSPAGACDLDTAGHWYGIPASAASVADSASTTDATATFRFGLRPGDATPPGDYLAHVAFEVTAPAL